jgi:hypothetical protein
VLIVDMVDSGLGLSKSRGRVTVANLADLDPDMRGERNGRTQLGADQILCRHRRLSIARNRTLLRVRADRRLSSAQRPPNSTAELLSKRFRQMIGAAGYSALDGTCLALVGLIMAGIPGLSSFAQRGSASADHHPYTP